MRSVLLVCFLIISARRQEARTHGVKEEGMSCRVSLVSHTHLCISEMALSFYREALSLPASTGTQSQGEAFGDN